MAYDKILNRATDLSGERELEPREYHPVPSLRKLQIPSLAHTISANKLKVKINLAPKGNVI